MLFPHTIRSLGAFRQRRGASLLRTGQAGLRLGIVLAVLLSGGRAGAQSAPLPPAVESLPEVQTSAGLTLDQAIDLCLCNDPKLHAGWEAVRQANAELCTAGLLPNPQVNVGGVLLPLSRRFTPEDPAGPSELDVGLTYSLDWWLFGKRAAALVSATRGVCISEAEYADMVRQRVTEAALAFYDLLEAKASLEVGRQDVQNLERVEAVTRKAVDSGGRPQVELNRVLLELLTTRRALREAESAVVNAKAALRALLGQCGPDPTFDVAGTLDTPLTVEPLDVEQAYATAIENRPDLLALRRKVAKARADTVVEARNALPEVTTNVGLAQQFQQSIGATDATLWGTGLTMSVPLFNRNQGNRCKADSLLAQSNYELQTGLIELRAEIEQSVDALRTAQQNAASVAQEELRLAGQVREAIEKAYEAGGRPLIDVLDAQRNYRDTYRIYISSRAEYWRSVYKFHSALGTQELQ